MTHARSLIEMAVPSEHFRKQRYYHGTSGVNGDLVLKQGLRPGNSIYKGHETPIPGKVYITTVIETALGYTRYEGGYAYVFEIDPSDVTDVVVDEDSILRLPRLYEMHTEGLSVRGGDGDYGSNLEANIPFLVDVGEFIKSNVDEEEYRLISSGLRGGTTVAKKISSLLPDWMQFKLLELGADAAIDVSSGAVYPSRCWKILPADGCNAKNFFDRAEEVDLAF